MKKKSPAKGIVSKLSTIGGDKAHELVYKSLLRLNPHFHIHIILNHRHIQIQLELTATLIPTHQQPFIPQPIRKHANATTSALVTVHYSVVGGLLRWLLPIL